MSDDDPEIRFIHPMTGKEETRHFSDFSEKDQKILRDMASMSVQDVSIASELVCWNCNRMISCFDGEWNIHTGQAHCKKCDVKWQLTPAKQAT